MKKLTTGILIKIILTIIIVGCWLFAANLVYHQLIKAKEVDSLLVESYRVQINFETIKKAADSLKREEIKIEEVIPVEETTELPEEEINGTASASEIND